MASTQSQNSKCRKKKIPSSQPLKLSILADLDADDDFQDPFPSLLSSKTALTQHPLKPTNNFSARPSKKLKNLEQLIDPGKENNFVSPNVPEPVDAVEDNGFNGEVELDFLDEGLDSIESTIDYKRDGSSSNGDNGEEKKLGLEQLGKAEFLLNSNELRLVNTGGKDGEEEFEGGVELDLLLKLCNGDEDSRGSERGFSFRSDLDINEENSRLEEERDGSICCPLCGKDISELNDELRQVHTNECIDRGEISNDVVHPVDATTHQCPGQVLDGSPGQSARKGVDVSSVLEWLRNLGLAKYEEIFVREEIDWDTLKWLTEEDLCNIGVTTLGPRKKLVHAVSEMQKESCKAEETHPDVMKVEVDGNNKLCTNKLITDYFPGSVAERKRDCSSFKGKEIQKIHTNSAPRNLKGKKYMKTVKQKDIPSWCVIPGTPFRVDAFKYLSRDCSYWFLTHFHMDHYQGLTRSFCHGKMYCSPITARLVNMKLGISWDKLQVLPLNQKINIGGIEVTCFDANHCPGAIIILFEPQNGKAVLHTGDFRFSEEIARIPTLQTSAIHTLILDTTYCDSQYDFPKQDAVIQFVIEAIQAEEFNPKTLFLIGSYTIGKERLFMEVARVLRKKVYVGAAKLRLLECLGFSKEDMQWFTLNEHESHIHVAPMWILASFKRLKHIANQYAGRFNLIVAFSPTGWTFGKGKKKSTGRRWQQGTIIRYEVPYSEHCSFTELRDFVKFISPASIIPSVNNHSPESANTMISRLLA